MSVYHRITGAQNLVKGEALPSLLPNSGHQLSCDKLTQPNVSSFYTPPFRKNTFFRTQQCQSSQWSAILVYKFGSHFPCFHICLDFYLWTTDLNGKFPMNVLLLFANFIFQRTCIGSDASQLKNQCWSLLEASWGRIRHKQTLTSLDQWRTSLFVTWLGKWRQILCTAHVWNFLSMNFFTMKFTTTNQRAGHNIYNRSFNVRLPWKTRLGFHSQIQPGGV